MVVHRGVPASTQQMLVPVHWLVVEQVVKHAPVVPHAYVPQFTQTPPSLPQLAAPVPATHVPPTVLLQHPPLHGTPARHELVHRPLLQAVCMGQAEQTTPPSPHCASVFPATHVPLVAALQQPPLHTYPRSQDLVHFWFTHA